MDPYNTLTSVAGKGVDLYAGTYSSGLFVSHDGGENWTHATLTLFLITSYPESIP
jgi:hypothetical protein